MTGFRRTLRSAGNLCGPVLITPEKSVKIAALRRATTRWPALTPAIAELIDPGRADDPMRASSFPTCAARVITRPNTSTDR